MQCLEFMNARSCAFNMLSRCNLSTSISSFSNKKVARFRSLLGVDRKNKFNGDDLIVLEGHRHVIDSIERGLIPSLCLVSNRALVAPLGCMLCTLLADNSIKYDMVDDNVLQRLSSSEHSQGVLAAVPRSSLRNYITLSEKNKDDSDIDSTVCMLLKSLVSNPIMLLLDGIQDPGNLGTLYRNAYGFGAGCVVTVGGCHPLSPKVIRSSLGTVLAPDLVSLSVRGDLLGQLSSVVQALARDRTLYLLTAGVPGARGSDSAVSEYAEIQGILENDSRATPKQSSVSPVVILVLGSEAEGISPEVTRWVDSISGDPLGGVKVVPITIPMWSRSAGHSGALDSLNVANAGAILLCELSRIMRSRDWDMR